MEIKLERDIIFEGINYIKEHNFNPTENKQWVSVESLEKGDNKVSFEIAETIRKRFPNVSEKWLLQKAMDEYVLKMLQKTKR